MLDGTCASGFAGNRADSYVGSANETCGGNVGKANLEKVAQGHGFLVVSLNPTYQVVVGYGRLEQGRVNRTDSWRNGFSGKGFNVARNLAALGAKAVLLTHMNPSRISECEEEAKSLGFEVSCIADPSQIRTCVTLLQNRRSDGSVPFDDSLPMTTTELVENTPPIEGADTNDRVMDRFCKLLESCSCVIITGTRSPGYDDAIYANMVRLARKAGRFVVLDIKGRDLMECLSNEECFSNNGGLSNEVHSSAGGYLPNIIKPNLEEFVQTFGCSEDPVCTLESLGCNAVITDGAKGCFVYDHDNGGAVSLMDALKVRSRNTTGCGDAFTAALAYSLMQGLSLEEACRKASIAGAAKAQERPFI